MPLSYRFVLVDIGEAGHHSDGGTLSNLSFGQALDNDLLSIPQPSLLPSPTEYHRATSSICYCRGHGIPFEVLHDASLPRTIFIRCSKFITNSLSMFYHVEDQAIFNYRLSRARRIIENTFGILASRWRIFRHPIIAEPRVEVYTKAAIITSRQLNHPNIVHRDLLMVKMVQG